MQWHEAEARALELARSADAKALEIASKEIDRRLEGMNELRQQISTERGQYVLRSYYDEAHAQLRDTVDTRIKLLENFASNVQGRIWAIGAAVSAIVVAINLLLHYLGK